MSRHPERFNVTVDADQLGKAVAVALLEVNGHHAGCLTSSCPVGAELLEVGRKAGPRVLNELIGIGELLRR